MEGDGIRHFWKRRSEHFNPLPPYGGRRHHLFAFRRSVHFNPLPPYGGRPTAKPQHFFRSGISIHSLRMEGDSPMRDCWIPLCLFQSTPSAWRETVRIFLLPSAGTTFQSTPSAWRETTSLAVPSALTVFQSTPSAWRETVAKLKASMAASFQSTPSAWRETVGVLPVYQCRIGFQSTPSAWRETPTVCIFPDPFGISIHSLRMEGDVESRCIFL